MNVYDRADDSLSNDQTGWYRRRAFTAFCPSVTGTKGCFFFRDPHRIERRDFYGKDTSQTLSHRRTDAETMV